MSIRIAFIVGLAASLIALTACSRGGEDSGDPGSPESAGAWFEGVARRNPDNDKASEAALGRVLCLERLGRPDEARRIAADWVERDDDIADMFLGLVAGALTKKPVETLPAEDIADHRIRTRDFTP